jgi:hypothetical protein
MRRKVTILDITSQLRQMAIFSHFLVENEEALGMSSNLFQETSQID